MLENSSCLYAGSGILGLGALGRGWLLKNGLASFGASYASAKFAANRLWKSRRSWNMPLRAPPPCWEELAHAVNDAKLYVVIFCEVCKSFFEKGTRWLVAEYRVQCSLTRTLNHEVQLQLPLLQERTEPGQYAAGALAEAPLSPSQALEISSRRMTGDLRWWPCWPWLLLVCSTALLDTGVRADKLRPWYAYPRINPWDIDAPAPGRHMLTMQAVRSCSLCAQA